MATSTSDYSVRDYGAVGDGTTNDAAAIQAAVQAAGPGGTVYFPAGTYLVQTAITPLVDQTLIGAGRRIAFLKSASGLYAGTVQIRVNNVQVIELGFKGYQGSNYNQGVYVDGGQDALVERCWFEGPLNWGIVCINGSHRATLVNNIVTKNVGGNGIEVNDSNYCLIAYNTILDSGVNGIEVYQNNGRPIIGTRIIGNYISGAAASGIDPLGDFDTLILDNVINDCRVCGIIVTKGEVNSSIPSQYGTIRGNTLRGNGAGSSENGIHLTPGARSWSVIQNVVEASANCGIICYAASCVIDGNICTLNGRHGICVSTPGTGSVVSNNVCVDNAALGAGVGDGIRIETTACTLTANRCTDTRTPKRQGRGILLISSASGHTITANVLTGNLSPGLLDMGSNNMKTANVT